MNRSNQATVIIEAELRAAVATAQLAHIDIREPGDHIMRAQDCCWLDLCLTPRLRGARACYPNRWSAQRFEQIGELFFAPAGEVLHARTEGGTHTSLVCQIDPGLISKWFEGDPGWTEVRLGAGLDIRNQAMRCLLMRLATEVRHPEFASETWSRAASSRQKGCSLRARVHRLLPVRWVSRHRRASHTHSAGLPGFARGGSDSSHASAVSRAPST